MTINKITYLTAGVLLLGSALATTEHAKAAEQNRDKMKILLAEYDKDGRTSTCAINADPNDKHFQMPINLVDIHDHRCDDVDPDFYKDGELNYVNFPPGADNVRLLQRTTLKDILWPAPSSVVIKGIGCSNGTQPTIKDFGKYSYDDAGRWVFKPEYKKIICE